MTDVTLTREVRTKFTADVSHQDRALMREVKEMRELLRTVKALRRDQKLRFKAERREAREAAAEARKAREEARRRRLEEQRLNDVLRRRRRLLRGLGRGLGMPFRAARGLLPGPLLGAGLVGGAAYGLTQVVGAGIERQNTELRLASLIKSAEASVGRSTSFGQARAAALEAIRFARGEAVTTPGTTQDILSAFSDISIVGRQTGASFRDLLSLSATIASRGVLEGRPDTVSRDVRQLLMGRGGLNEIQTPQLAGDVAKEIAGLVKEGKRDAALERVIEALRLSTEERQAFGDSFTGIFSTFKDELNELAIIAGEPLLTWLTQEMKGWIEYIRTNRGEVIAWVKTVGEDLVSGAKSAASAIGDLTDAIGGFAGFVSGVFDLPSGFEALGSFFQSAPTPEERGATFGGALSDVLARDLTLKASERGFFDIAAPKEQRANLLGTRATAKTTIDARGARIYQTIQVETDDPARIASPALAQAFTETARRPIVTRLNLANGG